MGRSVDARTHISVKWQRNHYKTSSCICKWSVSWQSVNWAAMTKEVYAIYMTNKKSTFYITGHDVTLTSDHLPLNKFLKQMTLNNTVNNWVMEIKSFKIKFVHIAGKDNVLTDTLSRLIDIDPDVELQPELKDYEFGRYAFETLPKAKGKMVHEVITSSGVSTYVKLISHITILKIHLIQ